VSLFTALDPWGCGNGFFVHLAVWLDLYHNRLGKKKSEEYGLHTERCVETIIKEKTMAKFAETGECVCLKIRLPFTYSPVSESFPYYVNIFTIK
jgi:hypothetical protein